MNQESQFALLTVTTTYRNKSPFCLGSVGRGFQIISGNKLHACLPMLALTGDRNLLLMRLDCHSESLSSFQVTTTLSLLIKCITIGVYVFVPQPSPPNYEFHMAGPSVGSTTRISHLVWPTKWDFPAT